MYNKRENRVNPPLSVGENKLKFNQNCNNWMYSFASKNASNKMTKQDKIPFNIVGYMKS